MIKDRNTVSGVIADGTAVINHGDLADLTDNCKQEVDVTCSETQNTALAKGWRVKLEGAPGREGEKSLSTPLTLGGVIFYTTYLPPEVTEDAETCGPREGSGRLYALSLQDASAAINFNLANSVVVDGETIELQEEDRYQDLGAGIPPEVVSLGDDKVLPPGRDPIEVDVRTRWPTYWYQLGM
jgi:type IV pilus assembly protein PilY1